MSEKAPLPIALLIAAGYADLAPLSHWQEFGEASIRGLRPLLLCAVLAPFVPLGAFLILRLTSWRLGRGQALLLAVASALGGFMSLMISALSGAGFLISLVQGITLTMAVAAAMLMLGRPVPRSATESVGLIVIMMPATVAAWSLIAGGAVILQAKQISDGQPYCLARHGDGKAVKSIADLRGLSFYTNRSVYKDTSTWFFHGVLLVQTPSGLAVYNWSPRRLTFNAVSQPGALIENPSEECTPARGFIGTLPLI